MITASERNFISLRMANNQANQPLLVGNEIINVTKSFTDQLRQSGNFKISKGNPHIVTNIVIGEEYLEVVNNNHQFNAELLRNYDDLFLDQAIHGNPHYFPI